MPSLEYYSPDYQTARRRFRTAAAALNAQQERHAICVEACQDQSLSVDTAWIGSDEPDWTLVLSSGLHGVDGFFGSAVQLAWLTQFATNGELHENGRIVFIHAINPYGFHFMRCVNEDNIDLNRNFILNGQDYDGLPEDYDQIKTFLNPRRPPFLLDTFWLRALGFMAIQGIPAFKAAISLGQYDDPQGVFFGGNSPALSACIIQANYKRWIGGARKALHLDLHTGLGKFGACKLLMAGQPNASQASWCQEQFGDDQVHVISDGKDITQRWFGTMGQWLCHHMSDMDYTFFNAAFGTYTQGTSTGALCADNRAHRYGQPGSLAYARVKTRLMNCFCPVSKKWRSSCLDKSLALVDRCAEALNGACPSDANPSQPSGP